MARRTVRRSVRSASQQVSKVDGSHGKKVPRRCFSESPRRTSTALKQSNRANRPRARSERGIGRACCLPIYPSSTEEFVAKDALVSGYLAEEWWRKPGPQTVLFDGCISAQASIAARVVQDITKTPFCELCSQWCAQDERSKLEAAMLAARGHAWHCYLRCNFAEVSLFVRSVYHHSVCGLRA